MSLEEKIVEQLTKKVNEMENATLKIALIGQPGAGKSSLINSLLGKEIFKISPETDTTQQAEEANFENLLITDLPGYGTTMFPLDAWLTQFHPEEYDMYLFVFSGKLHNTDALLFAKLKEWSLSRKHPYFIVRNKLDDVWDDFKSLEELQEEITKDLRSKMNSEAQKVFFTSAKTGEGVEALRNAILTSNLDEVKKSKFIQEFKAASLSDLALKREACKSIISLYAAAAGANAFNPLPGVDASLDLAVLCKMTKSIRKTFDLDDPLKWDMYIEGLGSMARPLIDKVSSYVSEEGVLLVLKQMGKRYAGKEFSKYIPYIGQTIACGMSFYMAYELGKNYADSCLELARCILESKVSE